MRIFLISDNHAYFGPEILKYASMSDEIWHAGDWLNLDLLHDLETLKKPIRSVWGNVDGHEIKAIFKQHEFFEVEGVTVFMTHIGGYPGRYNPKIKPLLQQYRPQLMVCGHSHILKVVRDPVGMLCINPGAVGKHGFHHMRTALTFEINKGKIENMQAIEFGPRAAYTPEQ